MRIFMLSSMLLAGSLVTSTIAQVGCMDNSYHMNPNVCDYKQLHYVQCNCPCQRYEHDFKRGKCVKCMHFSVPDDWVIVRSTGCHAQ